jgi:hypothetical protein
MPNIDKAVRPRLTTSAVSTMPAAQVAVLEVSMLSKFLTSTPTQPSSPVNVYGIGKPIHNWDRDKGIGTD